MDNEEKFIKEALLDELNDFNEYVDEYEFQCSSCGAPYESELDASTCPCWEYEP